MRRLILPSVAIAAGCLLVLGGGGARATTAPIPRTVQASVIDVRPRTMRVGTVIPASRVGEPRTFFGNSVGVAIGAGNNAQYPVQTTDGGHAWRTDGPALHIDAADAPQVVATVTAATRTFQYAYGEGQVVDVTTTGGPTWYGAVFQGLVVAVSPVPNRTDALVALINIGTGPSGRTVQYLTTDGGRSWHKSTLLGG